MAKDVHRVASVNDTRVLKTVDDSKFASLSKEDAARAAAPRFAEAMVFSVAAAFIPGSYATYQLYGAWKGWKGYNYDQIPSYDD
ncbi:hypothetical protein AM588_10002414 [Phytophthora nicotianae]|uniref:Uncharacterized protein n=1 Tax=Phytophthora nicotianae TaxID=4792 RepID=A0A0W8D0D3_PHYNI|nr:hypothetical protein AM588_10002414 [Phytophthora nicotianae]